MIWKSLIFILICSVARAEAPRWTSEVVSQTAGSCENRSLVFSALRFSKIPLNKTVDDRPVFLRLLFYINRDGSYVIRLTEQLLLGCVNDQINPECRFAQIADDWTEGQGQFQPEVLLLDKGEVSKKGTEPYRGYYLKAQNFSKYPEISGLDLPGTVVMVNFDSQGRNSDRICSEN